MKTTVVIISGKLVGHLGYINGDFENRRINAITSAVVYFRDGTAARYKMASLREANIFDVTFEVTS